MCLLHVAQAAEDTLKALSFLHSKKKFTNADVRSEHILLSQDFNKAKLYALTFDREPQLMERSQSVDARTSVYKSPQTWCGAADSTGNVYVVQPAGVRVCVLHGGGTGVPAADQNDPEWEGISWFHCVPHPRPNVVVALSETNEGGEAPGLDGYSAPQLDRRPNYPRCLCYLLRCLRYLLRCLRHRRCLCCLRCLLRYAMGVVLLQILTGQSGSTVNSRASGGTLLGFVGFTTPAPPVWALGTYSTCSEANECGLAMATTHKQNERDVIHGVSQARGPTEPWMGRAAIGTWMDVDVDGGMGWATASPTDCGMR